MSKSRVADSPAAYADVKHVMDLAVKRPGLRYELKSYGKAIHFRQRCYKYRNLLREMQNDQISLVPGFRAETIYDTIIIRQLNSSGESDRKGHILIFEHNAAEGTLIDPETGESLDPFSDHLTSGGLDGDH